MKVKGIPKGNTITMKTTVAKAPVKSYQWWKSSNKKERGDELLATVGYLRENQQDRQRKAAIFARLYGNTTIFNFAGANMRSIAQNSNLPIDRPTFNIIQSAVDTLVAKISQSRPSPVFLTDNGDYKERNLAKKLNNFIQGEFYQTETYRVAEFVLRDALVEGTGIIKVYEKDNKVCIERRLLTEIMIDEDDGIYGSPRTIYEVKLVDRDSLKDCFPEYKSLIETANKATVDTSSQSSKSIADQVMVVESWHLKSGKEAKDGRHTIACSSGIILDEEYKKDKFPFVFLQYSPALIGFWAQGLAEQLMGTQMEINALLWQISKAIKIVGVPRVFVEAGSKVLKTSLNNDIGAIIEYRGTPPQYQIAPCVPQELYDQLQRLINYGYQQCGVSALDAGAQKPQGLNSGEAIRTYDDISTDRFAAVSKRYDNLFVDLAYQIIDLAKEIAEREGNYETIFPDKKGTKTIELPKLSLLKNPFVIQCFNMSSLPRDPAGRLQKITEMIQSGMISIQEGRRLLDYPDLGQIETLANASEERIYQYLDAIIEDGDYTPPDSFMNINLASDIAVQYYNLYASAKLEEEKLDMISSFFNQCTALKAAAVPPQQPTSAGNPPQATPEPLPQSPLVPNSPQ